MTRRHPRRPAGLAIPAGAVNGFGTSADFYDSVGVNVHWKPNGAYGNPTTMVQDLANLGVRHARDTMTGSWWSTVYLYYRAANVVVRNRNASLPAVSSTDRGQPLFLSIHTPGWTGNQPQGFGNDFSFTVDDWYDMWEAGRAHWQPQLSPRTQIADGTTSNPDAAVPNPWAWADPELDWSIVGQMTSANEPNNTAIGNLKAWTKELNDKLKPRKSTVAFGGLPVVTVNGIQSHCSVSQIPMVGPSVINNGTAQSAGDMSQNTGVCDLGDQHPYHVGHEPSQEKVTKDLTQTGLCFNGQLASPPSSANSLPFVFTEWGQITRGVGNIAYPGAHDGYWPKPAQNRRVLRAGGHVETEAGDLGCWLFGEGFVLRLGFELNRPNYVWQEPALRDVHGPGRLGVGVDGRCVPRERRPARHVAATAEQQHLVVVHHAAGDVVGPRGRQLEHRYQPAAVDGQRNRWSVHPGQPESDGDVAGRGDCL
jgi:hypothetical protein